MMILTGTVVISVIFQIANILAERRWAFLVKIFCCKAEKAKAIRNNTSKDSRYCKQLDTLKPQTTL